MDIITQNCKKDRIYYEMVSHFINEDASDKKYDIQYKRLKRWTRNINLFNGKIEYIYIPICENEHWNLAIICYPHKAGKIIEDHIN